MCCVLAVCVVCAWRVCYFVDGCVFFNVCVLSVRWLIAVRLLLVRCMSAVCEFVVCSVVCCSLFVAWCLLVVACRSLFGVF